MDLIDRQAAIDAINRAFARVFALDGIEPLGEKVLKDVPSAESEIIRCKDCRWWDKYGDYDNGYCMAARHSCYSEHWEINIRRTYKEDFYCADAEPKEEQEWTI